MRKEDTVKLISAEGFEFVIDRKAALVSNTLKNMLTSSECMMERTLRACEQEDLLKFGFKSSPVHSNLLDLRGDSYFFHDFTETELGEVRFPEISTPILEKVCQYFYWSLQFASGKETEFHIEPEITLELMMAANYLHT